MKLIEQYIPKTAKGRRPQIPMTPIYITVHGTGNPKSTAKNEADNVCNNEPDSQISFHIVVDDKEAYKLLPFNEISWNAGDGKNGFGNRKSISIEICESGDREKTLLNAVEIIHDLMVEFNIGVDDVKQHYDWSKKDCPRILRNQDYIVGGMDWNWFIDKLQDSFEPDYQLLYENALSQIETQKAINGKLLDKLDRMTKIINE
jgi:N-acetylmuramoyl-L-alanine amidase